MTHTDALALGAGTRLFTQILDNVVFGAGELTNSLMLGAGRAINLGVAEYLIRKGGGSPRRCGVGRADMHPPRPLGGGLP